MSKYDEIMKFLTPPRSHYVVSDDNDLIDKVHNENKEYQKNRTTDHDRINKLIEIRKWVSEMIEIKVETKFLKNVYTFIDTLIEEIKYESMRKYEIQNRLERYGKDDKLFRKFMNSYLTTIVLDNKGELK